VYLQHTEKLANLAKTALMYVPRRSVTDFLHNPFLTKSRSSK
jgi:hypothetical protein